jgi:hypothetical protein
LATSSSENIPNVSPKEVFTFYGEKHIIVANIASPQSVKNIIQNENVCISFIDILVQEGYQIKGKAQIINNNEIVFEELKKPLLEITKGIFPFDSITKILILESKKKSHPAIGYFLIKLKKSKSKVRNYPINCKTTFILQILNYSH